MQTRQPLSTLPAKDLADLSKYIRREIKHEKTSVKGTILTDILVKQINGVNLFVCDVRIISDKRIVRDVPVASTARDLVGEKGVPVFMQRDHTGNYVVIGRANYVNDVRTVNIYDLDELGLLFVAGLRKLPNGDIVNGFYDYGAHSQPINGIEQIGSVPYFNTNLNKAANYHYASADEYVSKTVSPKLSMWGVWALGIMLPDKGTETGKTQRGYTMSKVPFGDFSWGVSPWISFTETSVYT